jgi:hypothetical protein
VLLFQQHRRAGFALLLARLAPGLAGFAPGLLGGGFVLPLLARGAQQFVRAACLLGGVVFRR